VSRRGARGHLKRKAEDHGAQAMEGNCEDHGSARVLILQIAQQPSAIPGSGDAASRRPKRARAGL
jgi:hypothetical protein